MAAPHVTQFLAATNKFLAPINKSRTGVKATKKRIRQKKRYRPHAALSQHIGDAPMTALKKLLMHATVLTALAGSAQAEVVHGFTVTYNPEIFSGACFAEAYYPASRTTLMFVKAYRDNTTTWGVLIANKSWPTKGKNYDVVVTAGPEKNPGYRKTMTRSFFGTDRGGIAVNDLSADEMNNLAFDGQATVWFINKNDGKRIDAFRIDNSGNIIRALVACLKARAPNDNVAKTDPAKPPATPKKEDGGTGTGFFVAPKHVLTSAHVVKSCNAIYVKYPTYKAVQAYVVGFDAKNDLAVLKTSLPHDGIASFRLRGRLGEFVASYGFPYGNTLSSGGNFTTGGLTALRGFEDDSSVIQVSAPVQPGNSGGPLMDSSGAVVGVTKGILGTLGAAAAAGGAVPQNVNFGVSAGTVVTFLGASNIDAQVTGGGTKLEPEAIAELAQKFTVHVMCNN
jgi:serine protease Do